MIGATGQVGAQLSHALTDSGFSVTGTGSVPAGGLVSLDLRDHGRVRSVIRGERPDVVFLPAALTHVDRAEQHPDECAAVNIDGPRVVAETVADTAATLVFFSTDHVFDAAPGAWAEDDPVAPRHAYGRSKAAAEAVLRDLLPSRHLIIRPSWVFGPDARRKNFLYRAVDTLRRGEPLVVPDDQYGHPTFGPDLAAAAVELWLGGARGTMHVVGPDHLTRAAFARQIAEAYGLDGGLVRGVPTASLGQPAPRPGHVKLSTAKLFATLGRHPIRPPAVALRARPVE